MSVKSITDSDISSLEKEIKELDSVIKKYRKDLEKTNVLISNILQKIKNIKEKNPENNDELKMHEDRLESILIKLRQDEKILNSKIVERFRLLVKLSTSKEQFEESSNIIKETSISEPDLDKELKILEQIKENLTKIKKIKEKLSLKIISTDVDEQFKQFNTKNALKKIEDYNNKILDLLKKLDNSMIENPKSISSRGGRKSIKTRKSRKSRKSKKSRKPRKSRKSRKY
jgi:DNA repair exonuclease SbcCD ATPase subunit